jgi:predicted component of type VI protein secretion system
MRCRALRSGTSPFRPPGIPVLENNQYFAFNQSGEQWKKILESRQVSVFVPPDIQDARMELMIALG